MNNYQVINPPFKIRFKDPFHLEFRNLSKTEAHDYFRWFIEQIPLRIRILAGAVQSTLGYENWIPDLSPQSLGVLGKWFKQVVSTRNQEPEEIEEIYDNSPRWFKEVEIEEWDLSPQTYSLCYDVGMYFAQVLLKNVNGLTWKLVTEPPTSVDIHQPVLTGLGRVDLNPVHVTTVIAFGFADNTDKEDALMKLYNRLARSM